MIAPPTNGAWVSKGGDCDDDAKLVFPGEPAFEPSGYTAPSSVLSFDYDCSGVEVPDPSQKGAAPTCASALNCTGSGFQPTTRTGPGVNSLCGSKDLVTCTKVSLKCVGVVSQVADPVRCH